MATKFMCDNSATCACEQCLDERGECDCGNCEACDEDSHYTLGEEVLFDSQPNAKGTVLLGIRLTTGEYEMLVKSAAWSSLSVIEEARYILTQYLEWSCDE